MNEEGRTERISVAVAALADIPGQYEQISIPWNGELIIVPVIRIPLDAIVLNQRSHRIKAELESHPERVDIAADPFSEHAQEVLSALLRGTDDYAILKEDLKEHGQRDFGVVTRIGLLVNANTRAVALRELSEDTIKVAVLPADADQRSLEDLEAYLQMRVERKQPYSFPNELLFIEDMKNRGKSDEELALQLGYAASTDNAEIKRGKDRVQQSIRILALMREVSDMSGNKVPLTFFDTKNQALQEIDTVYERMKTQNPVAALRVRDGRLLALVANVGYREMRLIDEEFLISYLPQGLAENDDLKGVANSLAAAPETEPESASTTESDFLDLFGGASDAQSSDVPDVSPVLTALIQAQGSDTVVLPGSDAPVKRTDVIDGLRNVYEISADEYKADKSSQGKVSEPAALVADAAKKVNKATQRVSEVVGDPAFRADKLDEAIAVLERSISALKAAMVTEQPTLDG
jgi:hypothetical protein